MLKLILLTLTISLVSHGADKQRAWKTGRVLDSSSSQRTYATRSSSNTATQVNGTLSPDYGAGSSINATADSRTNTTVHHVTIQTNELMIAGEGYSYVIRDERMKEGPILRKALQNRHHGCRFIVGEDVKYAQEKGDLYVIDADGKECKTPILRQEKLEPVK